MRRMSRAHWRGRTTGTLAAIFVLLASAVVLYLVTRSAPADDEAASHLEQAAAPRPTLSADDWQRRVRPVMERRCVVCHGCYDAPCQLKLSSIEGLRRGASPVPVYNPARIHAGTPTRLFIDAHDVRQWRALGFHPVINEGPQRDPRHNLDDSVLYRLLQLKQQHPLPAGRRLSADFTLELDREQSCPTLASIDRYANEHPLWGMPYAMPKLSRSEHRTLVEWLAAGAPAPPPPGPSPAVEPQIRRWETFLNGHSDKQRLVSRYLYEHLFLAHLHFAGSDPREFYRLVRSRTPPGKTVDEIPTLRPYDDPGPAPFYYRLLRYQPAIVAKNHVVYELSDGRMQRLRELFLEPDYAVKKLPSYEPKITSNPFKVFVDLPLESRYRFLLDDAHFFIEGFIKGPVCRGQIALNVIEDRFWVLFFDPGQPVFTNDAGFIGRHADDLQLPNEARSTLNLFGIWSDYWQRQRRYMATKQSLFAQIGNHDIQHALGYLWDGDGSNPNAALTVFRHRDSGSVAYGLVGGDPETAWVIDYPLFERIHYLLVAGFDVWGNLVHQANTRIYMDFLRMEGEDHFLAFLPASRRKAIRDSWYTGLRAGVEEIFRAPQDWLSVDSVHGYRSDDPQHELYGYLRERLAALAPRAEALNRCGAHSCPEPTESAHAAELEAARSRIASMRGARLHALPDVAFVRIRTGEPQRDIAWSLIRNKAYKNVMPFLVGQDERDRSDIDQDSMTVVDWLEGSYPNFFFEVSASEIGAFGRRCAAIRSDADYERFIERYGIRRTSPDFWSAADWFQDRYAQDKPVQAGLFDLNRYYDR